MCIPAVYYTLFVFLVFFFGLVSSVGGTDKRRFTSNSLCSCGMKNINRLMTKTKNTTETCQLLFNIFKLRPKNEVNTQVHENSIPLMAT